MSKEKEKSKSLETLLVLTGAFVLLFWVYKKKIFLLLALLMVFISIVSPYLAGKISWVWLKFSELLGAVMSKVILGLVFFLFLTPIAFAYRLFKNDSLSLKRKGTSYFTNRDHLYTKKDLENTW